MKIIHVIGDVRASSGTTTLVRELSCQQIVADHQIKIFSTDYNFRGSTIKDFDPSVLHIYRAGLDGWKYSPPLLRALEDEEADVINAHGFWDYPVLAAAIAAKRKNKPFLLCPSGMLDAWSLIQKRTKKSIYLKVIGDYILKTASAIHFTSEKERKNFPLKKYAEKGVVVPLGIHSPPKKEGAGSKFRSKYGVGEAVNIILFLGRIHYKKCPELAIDAFAQLIREQREEVCLIFAGPCESQYRNALMKRASKLGVAKKIKFIGCLQREEVYEAYTAANVYILPSFQENFGFTVLEAMASSCPVVVSESIDLAEPIADSGGGFSVQMNAELMADAIKKVISNPELSEQMGEKARHWANQFSWENTEKKLLLVYERIIKNQQNHVK